MGLRDLSGYNASRANHCPIFLWRTLRRAPRSGNACVYQEFFKLDCMPFDNTPDPRFFFATPDHEEALAALRYGVVQRRGITVVTGGPGSGKTLLGRVLVTSLEEQIDPGFIPVARESGHELIASICRVFEVRYSPTDTTGELLDRLHLVLADRSATGRIPTVILDDAQNLTNEALEHLRLLSNLETDTGKLLQIILLGQPGLAGLLRADGLEPVRQRVFCSRRINLLTGSQTQAYISHRLALAGAVDQTVFTDGAVELIHERSGGVPRWINQIADNTLLVAFGVSKSKVDRELVLEAIDHMMALQLLPSSEGPDAPLPQNPTGGTAAPVGQYAGQEHQTHAMQDATRTVWDLLARLTQINRLAERQIGILSASTDAAQTTAVRLEAGQREADQSATTCERNAQRLNALLRESNTATTQIQTITDEARRQAESVTRNLVAQADRATPVLDSLRVGQDALKEQVGGAEKLADRLQTHLEQSSAAVERAEDQTQRLEEQSVSAAQAASAIDEARQAARADVEAWQAEAAGGAALLEELRHNHGALREQIERAEQATAAAAEQTQRLGKRTEVAEGVAATVGQTNRDGQKVLENLQSQTARAAVVGGQVDKHTQNLRNTIDETQRVSARAEHTNAEAAAQTERLKNTARDVQNLEQQLGDRVDTAQAMVSSITEADRAGGELLEDLQSHAARAAVVSGQVQKHVEDLQNKIDQTQKVAIRLRYRRKKRGGNSNRTSRCSRIT